jgi:hypothetical protein
VKSALEVKFHIFSPCGKTDWIPKILFSVKLADVAAQVHLQELLVSPVEVVIAFCNHLILRVLDHVFFATVLPLEVPNFGKQLIEIEPVDEEKSHFILDVILVFAIWFQEYRLIFQFVYISSLNQQNNNEEDETGKAENDPSDTCELG